MGDEVFFGFTSKEDEIFIVVAINASLCCVEECITLLQLQGLNIGTLRE